MKIAIIDDDKYFLIRIFDILKQEYSEKDIDTFTSIFDYEQSSKKYDLVCLDIELKDENGLNYIQKHIFYDTYVIFVSSHEECMIKAYHPNVLGFIPKHRMNQLLIKRIHEIEYIINSIPIIELNTVQGIKKIRQNEILYFYLYEGFVYVKLSNQRKELLNNRTLKEFIHLDPSKFMRVNKNYIVQLSKIESVIRSTQSIIMEDSEHIKVSRRMWVEFKRNYHSMRISSC